MTQDTRHSDYLLAKPGDTDIQELSHNYYLSHQFRRIPFLLYKFWLILNFPIMLIMILYLASNWYEQTFTRMFAGTSSYPETSLLISFMFFLYGCCQMLYAMKEKRPRIAQGSFLKFQYALISSVTTVIVTVKKNFLQNLSILQWLLWFYMVFCPVVHLVGAERVLQAFQKNSSLRRNGSYSEDMGQDFVEQNELMAMKISKFDEKLNSGPYFLYKLLLKLSVVLELIFVFQYALHELSSVWRMEEGFRKLLQIDFSLNFFLVIWGISSLIICYCCFQMEIATRTKDLMKAERAVILLKICILLSMIKCLFVRKCFALDAMFGSMHFWWFGGSLLGNILSLIGALKVRKVLEARLSFIKVSSYPEDAYV